jgi:hypothetical protein
LEKLVEKERESERQRERENWMSEIERESVT